MTHDELADAFADLFAELHAKVDAMEEGPLKTAANAFANVSHHALNKLREKAVNEGAIMPMSGGGPKG